MRDGKRGERMGDGKEVGDNESRGKERRGSVRRKRERESGRREKLGNGNERGEVGRR